MKPLSARQLARAKRLPRLPAQLDMFSKRVRRGPDPYEIALHGQVVDMLRRWAREDWFYTHFPAGGLRDAKTAAKLKRMGTKPGVPDLILFAPDPAHGVHFVEIKRRGGRLSEAQEAFRQWAERRGYPYEVISDFDSALIVLRGWGVIRTTVAAQ